MAEEQSEAARHFNAGMMLVLGIEGPFNNVKEDRGGATNWGISHRFARELAARDPEWLRKLDADGDGVVSVEDMKALRPDLAREIYRVEFWQRYRCGEVPYPAAAMYFSYIVNMAPKAAQIVLQRAINRAAGRNVIAEDGAVGPKTIMWARRVDVAELCKRLDAEASVHYADLALTQPAFGDGWQYRSADALWFAAVEWTMRRTGAQAEPGPRLALDMDGGLAEPAGPAVA